MDGKVLREFPDGSKMVETRDGNIAFVVDPEKFAFNRWADSPMLGHMIRSYANAARTDKHILKGLNNIASGYAYTRLPDNYDKHLKSEVSRFMDALRYEGAIESWKFELDTMFRNARLEYTHCGTRETKQIAVATRTNNDLLVGRLDALIDDGYGVDLSKFVFPPKEKLQAMAGIKPKRFEDVKADLIDYAKKVMPNVPVQGVAESLISSAAKKICETQPMCTQPVTGAVAEAVNSIDFQYVPKRAVYKIDVGAIEPEKISEKIAEIKEAFNKHTHPTGVGPTQPLVMDLRMQRKKDGLCPECGDIKRESAVGVCRDHGKFMG